MVIPDAGLQEGFAGLFRHGHPTQTRTFGRKCAAADKHYTRLLIIVRISSSRQKRNDRPSFAQHFQRAANGGRGLLLPKLLPTVDRTLCQTSPH
jgi:hypothetical protein